MAIKYAFDTHVVAFPSKVIASKGGKHIYNIQLATDTDNGNFIGKGDFVELDLYKEATVATISAKIVGKATNGHYYVEITADTDALFVYQEPLIAEEYSNAFKKESNFYNAKGDVVRAYELAKGDVVEVSAEAFDGTPTVGTEITAISDKKLKIA